MQPFIVNHFGVHPKRWEILGKRLDSLHRFVNEFAEEVASGTLVPVGDEVLRLAKVLWILKRWPKQWSVKPKLTGLRTDGPMFGGL